MSKDVQEQQMEEEVQAFLALTKDLDDPQRGELVLEIFKDLDLKIQRVVANEVSNLLATALHGPTLSNKIAQ